QQALQSGEIPMGEYYHDVTGLAAADGFPVRSTFPQEGGVLDSGSWAVSRASDKLEEAQTFIDWLMQPRVQDLVARSIGTAPTVEREHLSLSEEEFAAVSSEIDPIIPLYDIYLEMGDWINHIWAERITRCPLTSSTTPAQHGGSPRYPSVHPPAAPLVSRFAQHNKT